MAAILSDSRDADPTAPARQPMVMWLTAVMLGLTLLGVADYIRTGWRSGGFVLQDVRSRLVWEEGRKVLLIEGVIANRRRAGVSVAPIRLSVRNREGLDLYTWSVAAPKARLEPGDRASFVARLPAPPEDGVETAARLESPDETAPPAPSPMAAAPRARRIASAAPLRAIAFDDIPNLRKMP